MKKVKILLILKITLFSLILVIFGAMILGENAYPYALLAFVIFIITFRFAYWFYQKKKTD